MKSSFTSEPAGLGAIQASLNPQLQLLRSRIEAEVAKPAVLLVTSALAGDGTTLTAYALTRCFAHAGYRAALATSGAGDGGLHGVRTIRLPGEDGGAIARDELAGFVQTGRGSSDFTIVDAGGFLSSDAAMGLAPLVDGVLLTVRVGRAQSDEDEAMVRTIDYFRSRVLGVVATSATAVADFERLRPFPQPVARERVELRLESHAAQPYAFSAGRNGA